MTDGGSVAKCSIMNNLNISSVGRCLRMKFVRWGSLRVDPCYTLKTPIRYRLCLAVGKPLGRRPLRRESRPGRPSDISPRFFPDPNGVSEICTLSP